MLIRNQSIFGVLKMVENNVIVFDMEKEQLKQVLKNIAKQNNMTASDLATQAGVAPSTITGFLNDVPGRGHYGLSARTQNKISDAFPEFKEQIETPQPVEKSYQVPIIGVWHLDYRVNGVELGMPTSFTMDYTANIHQYSCVIRSPKFFTSNMFTTSLNTISMGNIEEVRYYLFKNVYSENLIDTKNKQVYCKTEIGNFLGYQVPYKGEYYLCDFWGKHVEHAGKVLKASKVEWTVQP